MRSLFGGSKVPHMTMEEAQKELKNDTSIVLIDVRSPQEYSQGHIPGSISLPTEKAPSIQEVVPDLNRRIFVYCLSGSRSERAAGVFIKQGYTNVTNIGGIGGWRGTLEK